MTSIAHPPMAQASQKTANCPRVAMCPCQTPLSHPSPNRRTAGRHRSTRNTPLEDHTSHAQPSTFHGPSAVQVSHRLICHVNLLSIADPRWIIHVPLFRPCNDLGQLTAMGSSLLMSLSKHPPVWIVLMLMIRMAPRLRTSIPSSLCLEGGKARKGPGSSRPVSYPSWNGVGHLMSDLRHPLPIAQCHLDLPLPHTDHQRQAWSLGELHQDRQGSDPGLLLSNVLWVPPDRRLTTDLN